jgi:adenylyl cyclase-associated protein
MHRPKVAALAEAQPADANGVDGWVAQVYLSDTSKGACITTAKSSEVNVLVPGGVDQDLVETPLPEQFSSTFENGKWVTVPVTHSAG